MEKINHKIRKGSLFNILDAANAAMDTNYFLLIFITDGKEKIKNDINKFTSDNMGAYGGYALINDHIDATLAELTGGQPALMQINADGMKRWGDIGAEKRFWYYVKKLSMSRRTKKRAVIVESGEPNIPLKIIQESDFIFAPKEMELDKKLNRMRKLIRY